MSSYLSLAQQPGDRIRFTPDSRRTENKDNDIRRGQTVKARVIDGDTLLMIDLPQVTVLAPRQFSSRSEERQYNRLVFNVKRVYPYARLAAIKLEEYNQQLEALESDAQRRRFIRQAEQEIRAQFEDELKRLTFSQGLILIKLIDRETTHTSYELLKELRGAISAVFWQSLGRLFGYNLRTRYDPHGEDKLIEEIVILIEAGLL